jgi:hypothetical protein
MNLVARPALRSGKRNARTGAAPPLSSGPCQSHTHVSDIVHLAQVDVCSILTIGWPTVADLCGRAFRFSWETPERLPCGGHGFAELRDDPELLHKPQRVPIDPAFQNLCH